MESIALDMDDMFDNRLNHDDEDDDLGFEQRRRLPDLDEDDVGEQQTGNNNGDEVLANLQNLTGAAKKKVSRSQPKLDPQRLQSERGLPALPSIFKNIKFKGKGHEAADLDVMMNTLEHWAHRLFPKLSFDDFIERLERLGNKREIKTSLKRIRFDMPMLDGDFIENEEQGEANAANNDKIDDMDIDEAYELMVRQERDSNLLTSSQSAADQSPLAPEPDNTTSSQTSQNCSQQSNPASASPSANQGLTAEQKERIEKNRLLAMQRRAQKLGIPLSSCSSGATKPVTDESGRRADVSGLGADDSVQGADESGRGADESGRGSDVLGRGADESGRGSDVSGRGADESGRGADESGHEDVESRSTVHEQAVCEGGDVVRGEGEGRKKEGGEEVMQTEDKILAELVADVND